MNWLNIIAKDHKKWVNYVRNFGEYNYAEDIVQEMYLKLVRMDEAQRTAADKRYALNYSTEDRVLNDNGTPNASYIWLVLRTMFIDFQKQKNKYQKISLNDIQIEESYNTDMEQAWGDFTTVVERESNTWQLYDRLLFNLYSSSKISMRDISEGTGIELRSIWNTINNCKGRIKIRLCDEYKELKNKEND